MEPHKQADRGVGLFGYTATDHHMFLIHLLLPHDGRTDGDAASQLTRGKMRWHSRGFPFSVTHKRGNSSFLAYFVLCFRV